MAPDHCTTEEMGPERGTAYLKLCSVCTRAEAGTRLLSSRLGLLPVLYCEPYLEPVCSQLAPYMIGVGADELRGAFGSGQC